MVDENEGDRLYALSLEEFTGARDALAARMRSAGDAAEAARIKGLRKPTTPAWAVNQLARRQADLVEQLIEGSERLRRAQHDLLQGGPAQAVWEATLAERELLGRLSHEAERILAGADYGATRGMLDRISDTLAAAAADEDGRALLRRGILTQEMHRAGFGDILGAPAAARPPAKDRDKPRPSSKPGKAGAATPKQVIEAERDAARLAREADKAEIERERLERAATRIEQEAASLRRRLASAERDATRARAEADAARKAAATAKREADKAADRYAKLGGRRRHG